MSKIINGEEFKKEVIDSKAEVLVDFYADWCGPCKAIEPIIDNLENEVEGIQVVKVDTDRFMSLTRDYHIVTVPNLKIFSRGKIVKEKTGIMTKDEIMNFVKVE